MIMAYDPKITEALVAWLKADHSDESVIRQGATLLLQVNRNRGLFERISRQPLRHVAKLEYEIRKHVNIRMDGYTIEDIEKLDSEVTPEVSGIVMEADRVEQQVKANFEGPELEVLAFPSTDESTKVVTGKRPDHDSLPEEIQAIWPKNAERWRKIKSAFELLKTLDAPCDRYEHLKLLKELWYKYKEDMARYDGYVLGNDGEGKQDEEQKRTGDAQKVIDNAQTYISKHLPSLLDLVDRAQDQDFKEQEKLESVRTFIQKRVDLLLQNGVNLSDQRKADLRKCDIRIELPSDDAEGEKSE